MRLKLADSYLVVKQILDELDQRDMTSLEIQQLIGIPRTTVFKLLNDMVDKKLIKIKKYIVDKTNRKRVYSLRRDYEVIHIEQSNSNLLRTKRKYIR